MNQALDPRIIRVVSEVFGLPSESVSRDSSPDTIAAWDSLSHINLILALEAEFKIALTPEEAMEMLSVGLIQTILSDRGLTVSG